MQKLTSISLIAIQIKFIRTSRRPHKLIIFNRLDPLPKPTSWFRVRPPPIRFQHFIQSYDPRRELHIDESEGGTEEEGAVFICCFDEFVDLSFEVLGFFGLEIGCLGLDVVVECWNDVAIDLITLR